MRISDWSSDVCSSDLQASAGLDLLSEAERARFTALNDAYRAKFGLPFVMAVKGHSKAEIHAALERRLQNDPAEERATALAEIERIDLLRRKELLHGVSPANPLPAPATGFRGWEK